jgi:Mg2+ and Co2+ transporter CorA
MNVNLPFQNNPLAFIFTVALAFAISLFAVYIFWKRDWF